MSWNSVDNKHKVRYDRNFVSCQEPYERKYIIDTILEEFPQYSRARVESAVDHCCKAIAAPRPRTTFLNCIQNELK